MSAYNRRYMLPPRDVESYVQETGCAGRNGQQSTAILHTNKLKHLDKSMQFYIIYIMKHETSCMFNHFDSYNYTSKGSK